MINTVLQSVPWPSTLCDKPTTSSKTSESIFLFPSYIPESGSGTMKLRSGRQNLSPVVNLGCFFLFVITTLAVTYRYVWRDARDPHKCEALLTQGRWLDAPKAKPRREPYQNWQPPGCTMHNYQTEDLVKCLESRKIIFLGDSTIRQIFWATAKKLGSIGPNHTMRASEKHTSLGFSRFGVSVEFTWDPYLNSTSLHQHLTAPPLLGSHGQSADIAAIIMIGGGLWHARHLGEAAVQSFNQSLARINQALNDEQSLRLNSGHSINFQDRLTVLAPVQVPWYDSLSSSRASTLTNETINSMIEIEQLQHLSAGHRISFASAFTLMTREEEKAYDPSGLHVVENISTRMADVVLNMRCNAVLNRKYPMDKTCCASYGSPNWTQYTLLFVSMAILPSLVLVTFKKSIVIIFLPSAKITQAITVIGVAACHCYFADRTQLWNKVQKEYTSKDFLILCSIILVLGIISVRRITGKTANHGFLSRDQTDEWKGWMQFIILIYHYTGGSKILRIYELIRILVASYLFLTGFGHTVFFYNRADYSFRRCASVLLRLNLLSCVLPYMMKTDYLFYYFAPLISFWYLVIYATMAVGHSRNQSLNFLIGKILFSACLATALIRAPGTFEPVFFCLQKCCNIHWDVKEWEFRLQLDSLVVYCGMLCGVIFIQVPAVLYRSGTEDNHSSTSVHKKFGRARCGSIAMAFVTLLAFCYLTGFSPNKLIYNSFVPYISFIPILSFVIVRNFSHHTRSFYSSVFAWMGRHSLETFTLQFHIWLAADTKGLLSTGVFTALGGRPIEFVVLTVIFLWICWHVAAASQTITSWVIDPKEDRECLELERQEMGAVKGLSRFTTQEGPDKQYGTDRSVNRIAAGAMQGTSKVMTVVGGDLRIRIALILGILWALNITYPAS